LDSIENDDPEELQRLLGHFSQMNEYFEIEDSVLMTPLLYAVKYKSPDCVDVLVTYGADITLSIKIQDEETDTERSLNTNALQYATGERDKASSAQDKVLYEDIIAILTEIQLKHGSFAHSNGEAAPGNSMTPSQLADVHRITQKTIQNQIAIKKLTEENEGLKREILILRQEIERFRPWIEKWIYHSTPNALPLTPLQQPLVTVEETETPTKREKKKRSSADNDKTPMKQDPSRKDSTSPSSARPKSIHSGAKPTTLRSSSDKPKKIIKKEKSIGGGPAGSPESEPVKTPKKKKSDADLAIKSPKPSEKSIELNIKSPKADREASIKSPKKNTSNNDLAIKTPKTTDKDKDSSTKPAKSDKDKDSSTKPAKSDKDKDTSTKTAKSTDKDKDSSTKPAKSSERPKRIRKKTADKKEH
jgi:hypothetical protein